MVRGARAVAIHGAETDAGAERRTEELRSLHNECRKLGGQRQHHPVAGRAPSNRGGIHSAPDAGIPGGPGRATARRRGNLLHGRGPREPARARRRRRRAHWTLPHRRRRSVCGSDPLFPVSAKAPGAAGRISGSASMSGTATPGPIRRPSHCAPRSGAGRKEPDRCRERFAPGPRSGSPGPWDRYPAVPRCECPAPPSGCPGRARWPPPSSRGAGARAEPERTPQPWPFTSPRLISALRASRPSPWAASRGPSSCRSPPRSASSAGSPTAQDATPRA